MFAKKINYTHKNCPVLRLKHSEDDDASVTTKHRGVDVGSIYRNNTTCLQGLLYDTYIFASSAKKLQYNIFSTNVYQVVYKYDKQKWAHG